MNAGSCHKLRKRLCLKGLGISKCVYHAIKFPAATKKIVFILGCQRSGTSLMEATFRKDLQAKTYPDCSKLIDPHDPNGIRLRPLPEVKKIFDSQKAGLIVAKALVETQHADLLLQNFPGCKIIWMYRDYKGVAKSNISHFGAPNGRNDLLPVVNEVKNNWRSEKVSVQTSRIVRELFSDNIIPHDASALFWYTRNVLFYELNLNSHKDVLMVRYEDKVSRPVEIVKGIYSFLGEKYPGNYLVKDIHTKALRRGEQVQLSPAVEELCGDLYERLEADYEQQKRKYLLP